MNAHSQARTHPWGALSGALMVDRAVSPASTSPKWQGGGRLLSGCFCCLWETGAWLLCQLETRCARLYSLIISLFLTNPRDKLKQLQHWREESVSPERGLMICMLLGGLKCNCEMISTDWHSVCENGVSVPPIICFCTMQLQWEDRITVLYTCLLQDATFQYIILFINQVLFVVSTYITSDKLLQTWDLYLPK